MALCERHAEEHLQDYVLPKQAEWDQARADLKRPLAPDDNLPRVASPPTPGAADLPRPSDEDPSSSNH